MHRLHRAVYILRVFGIRELIQRLGMKLFPPQPLSIAEVAKAGMSVASNSFGVTSILCRGSEIEALEEHRHLEFVAEWDKCLASLDLETATKFPPEYDVEVQTAKTLYVLTRWCRPKKILETGIARGLSSFALLSAVKANKMGVVYSVDVDPLAGDLVPEGLKDRWHKQTIDAKRAKVSFQDLVDHIEVVDFFFHDSNHRESWMKFEFDAVLKQMSPGGILGADDVDLNRSFLTVVPHASSSAVLLDSRKASAFAVVRCAPQLHASHVSDFEM